MQKLCLGLVLLILSSGVLARLPNHTRTPGVTNPDVGQENIHQTICVSGWTTTIRPPSSFTNNLKKQQIREYRYKEKRLVEYEEDHLISLQLGGHPTDPKNLWPQPYRITCSARINDALETELKRMVCDGQIALREAQHAIATNWIAAYKKYVHEEGCPEVDEE